MTLIAAACGVAAPRGTRTAVAGLIAVAGLAAIVALNRAFFAFLARRKGWRFACAALPLHLVYYCCCGLSVVIAMAHWRLGRFRNAPARPDRAAVPAPHLASERRSAAGKAGHAEYAETAENARTRRDARATEAVPE